MSRAHRKIVPLLLGILLLQWGLAGYQVREARAAEEAGTLPLREDMLGIWQSFTGDVDSTYIVLSMELGEDNRVTLDLIARSEKEGETKSRVMEGDYVFSGTSLLVMADDGVDADLVRVREINGELILQWAGALKDMPLHKVVTPGADGPAGAGTNSAITDISAENLPEAKKAGTSEPKTEENLPKLAGFTYAAFTGIVSRMPDRVVADAYPIEDYTSFSYGYENQEDAEQVFQEYLDYLDTLPLVGNTFTSDASTVSIYSNPGAENPAILVYRMHDPTNPYEGSGIETSLYLVGLQVYENPADEVSGDSVSGDDALAEVTSASDSGSDWTASVSGSASSRSASTKGEEEAAEMARSYLSVSAFSYDGLVVQLEFSGFTHSEAVFAADTCGADWKEQAVKSAASYLDVSAFSYQGLIDQLEFSQFTHEEAVYGADHCGADWREQAVKSAASYLDVMSFSREELINQLVFAGFTQEQAAYGVSRNGL